MLSNLVKRKPLKVFDPIRGVRRGIMTSCIEDLQVRGRQIFGYTDEQTVDIRLEDGTVIEDDEFLFTLADHSLVIFHIGDHDGMDIGDYIVDEEMEGTNSDDGHPDNAFREEDEDQDEDYAPVGVTIRGNGMSRRHSRRRRAKRRDPDFEWDSRGDFSANHHGFMEDTPPSSDEEEDYNEKNVPPECLANFFRKCEEKSADRITFITSKDLGTGYRIYQLPNPYCILTQEETESVLVKLDPLRYRRVKAINMQDFHLYVVETDGKLKLNRSSGEVELPGNVDEWAWKRAGVCTSQQSRKLFYRHRGDTCWKRSVTYLTKDPRRVLFQFYYETPEDEKMASKLVQYTPPPTFKKPRGPYQPTRRGRKRGRKRKIRIAESETETTVIITDHQLDPLIDDSDISNTSSPQLSQDSLDTSADVMVSLLQEFEASAERTFSNEETNFMTRLALLVTTKGMIGDTIQVSGYPNFSSVFKPLNLTHVKHILKTATFRRAGQEGVVPLPGYIYCFISESHKIKRKQFRCDMVNWKMYGKYKKTPTIENTYYFAVFQSDNCKTYKKTEIYESDSGKLIVHYTGDLGPITIEHQEL